MKDSTARITFLGLAEHEDNPPTVAVLPIPLELTVSYGRGTQKGPERLLDASAQVELFDSELDFEFNPSLGLRTVETWRPEEPLSPGQAVASIREYVRPWVQRGTFVVGLGGEHTVTLPLVLELAKIHGPMTVVQIDAHCDLRDRYQGSKFSHACVARRLLELGHTLIQIGIRSCNRTEWELCQTNEAITLFHARALHDEPNSLETLRMSLARVNRPTYLSIDVDGLDPSVVPGTGTPEPGGLGWYQALRIIGSVFSLCDVVGMDMVELAPIDGQHVSEFACARLLARSVALHLSGRRPL